MAARRNRRGRRRNRGRFSALYKLLSVLIIFAAILMGCVVFFRVSTVEITGDSPYTEEEIRRVSGVEQGDNLFTLNKYQISSRIYTQLPYIGTVNFERKYPDTFVIHVTASVPVAWIESGGSRWLMDTDCKLLESRDLRIAQGALTGESMPVRKDAAALLAAGARDTALTDAACLVFMGTTVISGSALAVVIATGRSALFGGLSRAFQWQRPRTRFERGMNSTSWMLMAFTAVTVPVSMLVTGIASGDWLQALLFGVSVAVGLTPEMLPLIVTVCLSRGARTMASGKAIVRRLDAIETLGGMDVLCVDKTGTLTSGVIKLDRAQSMSGLNSSYVLHAAWLTTLIPHTTSNPWDDAIVAAEGDSANDTGDVQVEGGTPFDPIRRRATVIVAKSHHRADREHTGGSDISETSGAGANVRERQPHHGRQGRRLRNAAPLRHRHAQWNRRAADRSTARNI